MTTINVPAGANLQEYINRAITGDVLQLAQNAVYVGNFVDNKGLTIQGPAILRASDLDAASPTIYYPPKTPPATLRNLIISSASVVTKQVHDIIRYGSGGADQNSLALVPQGLTIENCDIHGQPGQEVQRGISANGANFKIVNSKVREVHGRGYDTQAICSWNGPGPFLIEGCYLEAAAENVMFGGSPPSIPGLIHSDIQFRRNYCFKPLSWYVNDPSFAGIKWSVKNLFELKNARRAVIEGNVFENNWTDAQAGRAIVFTPRPSDSGSSAVIEDVVFQYNIIRNVGSGMLILGADEAPAPTETRLRRIRVAHNLWENVNGGKYGSNGFFATVINKTEDVTIEHNTVFQTGNIIGADYAPNIRFAYRDNISRHNQYGIFGGGIGNTAIANYFPGAVVTGNVMAKEVNSPSNAETLYPAGNFFPANLAAVGFVDLDAANYRLGSSSPYKGKGTSGSDPGCDIDKLTAMVSGVGTPTPLPDPQPPPPPPPPPPPTKVTSPDGTKAVTIIDAQLATWTIGPEKQTLRDGVHVASGSGTIYKWLGGIVYVLGVNLWWYKWTGTAWQSVSQLEPGTQPTTRVVPWPKQPGQQNSLLDQQWAAGRYRLRRVDGNSATFEVVN